MHAQEVVQEVKCGVLCVGKFENARSEATCITSKCTRTHWTDANSFLIKINWTFIVQVFLLSAGSNN